MLKNRQKVVTTISVGDYKYRNLALEKTIKVESNKTITTTVTLDTDGIDSNSLSSYLPFHVLHEQPPRHQLEDGIVATINNSFSITLLTKLTPLKTTRWAVRVLMPIYT